MEISFRTAIKLSTDPFDFICLKQNYVWSLMQAYILEELIAAYFKLLTQYRPKHWEHKETTKKRWQKGTHEARPTSKQRREHSIHQIKKVNRPK